LIKNLITKATTADDVLDKDGNVVKEGTGDLSAIQEIINRLEGKPSQKIVGPDDGPVRVEYRTGAAWLCLVFANVGHISTI
jgi:hypothetical protein